MFYAASLVGYLLKKRDNLPAYTSDTYLVRYRQSKIEEKQWGDDGESNLKSPGFLKGTLEDGKVAQWSWHTTTKSCSLKHRKGQTVKATLAFIQWQKPKRRRAERQRIRQLVHI